MLARAQRGAIGDPARVPLEQLVHEALRIEGPEIARLGLVVEDKTTPIQLLGNETLLARMVANLVENAVRHNVAGGLVQISDDARGKMVCLAIANSGVKIEQSQLSELGEPFRRLGPERVASGNGAGLGLSIVRAIAEAHGGSLELRARPEGGLVATVLLPSPAA